MAWWVLLLLVPLVYLVLLRSLPTEQQTACAADLYSQQQTGVGWHLQVRPATRCIRC
jgi:hypothetical protein